MYTDLASKKTKGSVGLGSEVDEVLSDVTSSFFISYKDYLSKKFSVGIEGGFRWHKYSKDLAVDILSDQDVFALRAGLTFGYDVASWYKVQASALWDQQLYFRAQNLINQDWQFEKANVFRTDLKVLFIPIDTKKFNLELGPVFSYFTGSSSSTGHGYALGGELSSFFLFKKTVGLHGRYTVSYTHLTLPTNREV